MNMSSERTVLGRNILNKLTEERKQELTVLCSEVFHEFVWKLPKNLNYEEYYFIFEDISKRCTFQMIDIFTKINNSNKD